MSAIRLASLLLTALVLLWQPAASWETKPDKYRVELNSGERFVLTSGTLTSDSLIGTTFSGKAKSVPIRSISSLERSKGSFAQVGAGVGAVLGVTCGWAFILRTGSDKTDNGRIENESSKIPLKLFACVVGGGLLGIVVGSSIDTWEPVAWSSVMGGRADNGGIKLQFSLSF